MKRFARVVPLIGLFALLGCSSSDDSGASTPPQADGGTATQEKTYCDGVANRKTSCGKGDGVCADEAKCLYGRKMKPAATTAYAECYGAPTCGSDDDCVGMAGSKVGGSAATSYISACQSKHTECGADFGDFCSAGAFAYTGVGEAANACLAKACADINACLTAAYAPIKSGCE